MLMSDQDQPNPDPAAANTVTYNQTILARGIEVRNGSEIWFEQPGQYLVNVTLKATNRGTDLAEMDVWVSRDGQDYPLSTTRYDLQPRKSSTVWHHIVPSISGIFTVSDPDTESMRIRWCASTTGVFLEHYNPSTNPTRPGVASAVVTISYVSRLPSTP